MSEDATFDWPWQYKFPPFFTLQPHAETRAKQLEAWRTLILDYFKAHKLSKLDIREAGELPLFNNAAIDRKLDSSALLVILHELQQMGNAVPLDKQKNRWEIYWHTLEEWGSLIYAAVTAKGMTNTVVTNFELTQGTDFQDDDFHNLDNDVLKKALTCLQKEKKCELILEDDCEGVKFF